MTTTIKRSGRVRLYGAVSAVLLVLAVTAYFVLRPTESILADELSIAAQDELEQVDGRLVLKTSADAFSGYMVSHYPDGVLRSRSQLVDGRLHGVSEGWYPDGTLETREHFRDGVSHGLRERWHPNGQLASRAEIKDGEFNGVFQRWHENGEPAQFIEMRGGVAHGRSLGYFPSGYLQAQVELHEGNVVQQEYWEDGQMKDVRK